MQWGDPAGRNSFPGRRNSKCRGHCTEAVRQASGFRLYLVNQEVRAGPQAGEWCDLSLTGEWALTSSPLASGLTREEHQTEAFAKSRESKGCRPDKVRIHGVLLSVDAVVADGAAGMKAGKSWLPSKPENEIRTRLWQTHQSEPDLNQAFLVWLMELTWAQLVKNLPAVQETSVWLIPEVSMFGAQWNESNHFRERLFPLRYTFYGAGQGEKCGHIWGTREITEKTNRFLIIYR